MLSSEWQLLVSSIAQSIDLGWDMDMGGYDSMFALASFQGTRPIVNTRW